MVIKIYYMKERKKKQTDPYAVNKQLENAYNWLRSNKHIKNAAELADAWGVSKSTVSAYLTRTRRLGLINATRFEANVLRRHNFTLAAFESDVLVRQAKLARKPSPHDIASLLATQLLRLESGQEIMLDKFTEMERVIGELRDIVIKLAKRASF
jgi:DNA-binding transcriptional ArsR family regulator